MGDILFVAHTEPDGTLAKPAREALTAAKRLAEGLGGATLTAGIVGEDLEHAADVLTGADAARILGVVSPDFAQARYASDTLAAEALCRAAGASVVVVPGTSRWNRVLPGVAHRLGGAADLHVTKLEASDGAVSATRWCYRQRIETVFQRRQRPWLIAVDPGAYEPWQGNARPGTAEQVSVKVPESCRRTSVVGFQTPSAGEQTIRPDAELLFVAGAGWTKKQSDGRTHLEEATALILKFLKKTQASLGGSKSLVDLSGEGQAVLPFMTHLNQVGQTGATPRHPKGLATCCHGEEPHVVGWRFINERRAVNTDPNCGWAHGKADVLYVADAFDVIEKVCALLEAEGA